MTADDLQIVLDERPFEPFRIVVDNDREYEIRHPEMVLLTERVIVIGLPFDPEKKRPESFQAIVGLPHISAILPAAA